MQEKIFCAIENCTFKIKRHIKKKSSKDHPKFAKKTSLWSFSCHFKKLRCNSIILHYVFMSSAVNMKSCAKIILLKLFALNILVEFCNCDAIKSNASKIFILDLKESSLIPLVEPDLVTTLTSQTVEQTTPPNPSKSNCSFSGNISITCYDHPISCLTEDRFCQHHDSFCCLSESKNVSKPLRQKVDCNKIQPKGDFALKCSILKRKCKNNERFCVNRNSEPLKNCCLRTINVVAPNTYKIKLGLPALRPVRKPRDIHLWSCFFLDEAHCRTSQLLLFSPFYTSCCMPGKSKETCFTMNEACAFKPSKYSNLSCCLDVGYTEKPSTSATSKETKRTKKPFTSTTLMYESKRTKKTKRTTEMTTTIGTTEDPVNSFDPRK